VNMLTSEQCAGLIRTWMSVMEAVERNTDALSDLLRPDPESPLIESIGRMQQRYTEVVANQVNDRSEWLMWFWLECHLGHHPKAAGPKGAVRPITSAEDLLWLLAAG